MQPDPSTVGRRLAELRVEHRELDTLIARMHESRDADELALRRFKKRKLMLKDWIAKLESMLIPDQPA